MEENDTIVVEKDAGIPPWKMDLNPLAKTFETSETETKNIGDLPPWKMDLAYKHPSPLTIGVEPKGPLPKSTPPIENIFNKMLIAESKNKHLDESGKLLTSPAGAKGISQLMPATARNPGFGITPVQDNSAEEYIRVGKSIFNAYTRELGGDVRKGVAAYNYGIGKVKQTISKHGDMWEGYLPTETKKYLKKVLG